MRHIKHIDLEAHLGWGQEKKENAYLSGRPGGGTLRIIGVAWPTRNFTRLHPRNVATQPQHRTFQKSSHPYSTALHLKAVKSWYPSLKLLYAFI